MQVSVEALGTVERKLMVTVPANEIDQEVSKRLSKLMKSVRISGFRPGKAPKNIVQQRYGDQLLEEVAHAAINTSYQKALDQEKIVPAGLLSIDPEELISGKDLKYVATIEIFPEIPMPTLKGQTIKQPVCKITEQDIESTHNGLRRQNAKFSQKQGQVEDSNRVTLDLVGTIEGKPFQGGSAKGFVFVVGSGELLQQFDVGVLGFSSGEQNVFQVDFPTDYHDQKVAGKMAEFTVTIKKIEQQELPNDDELLKSIHFEQGGIAELRNKIKKNLQLELDDRIQNVVRERVLTKLEEINPIEVPQSLIEKEIDWAIASIEAELKRQGLPQEKIERASFASKARQRVVQGLIVRDIIKRDQIEVDTDKVRQKIENMSSNYQEPEAFVRWYYSDKQKLGLIENKILEQQVIEKMLIDAMIEEEKISFKNFRQTSKTTS